VLNLATVRFQAIGAHVTTGDAAIDNKPLAALWKLSGGLFEKNEGIEAVLSCRRR
jgi:hypothetical protein